MGEIRVEKLDLFERLQSKVNKDTIYSLLAEYAQRFPGEIQVSGNKPELIDHLRNAAAIGRIPQEQVFDLLREGEENGGQTVLYYTPKSVAVRERCSRPEELAETLFGANWRQEQKFPKLIGLSSGYEVVDFRVGYMGKPNDWLMKIYTFQEREVEVQEIKPGEAAGRAILLGLKDNQYAVVMERQVVESVCIARWNDHPEHPLLELRVELAGRLPRFKMDVNAIWTRLQAAMHREEDFDLWELRRSLDRMLRDCQSNSDRYLLGLVNLKDSGEASIRYKPYTEHEPIDTNPTRLRTIHDLLDDGGQCDRLAINWLAEGSGGALERNLRTYAGSRGNNELVIHAEATSRAVDYVTDQLRSFAS